MQNISSNFEYFSSKRTKYFMATEDENLDHTTLTKQQRLAQTLKLSKSSGNILLNKIMGIQNRDQPQKFVHSKKDAKRLEMQALFSEQNYQNHEETKLHKKAKGLKIGIYNSSIKDNSPSKRKLYENNPQNLGNKSGLDQFLKTDLKADEKRSFCEDLTQPFTPTTNTDLFQEQIQKLISNQSIHIIQPNPQKTKSNQKGIATKKTKIQDFQVIKKLGKGVEGQVFLAIHKETGMIFAIKKIYKDYLNDERNEENLLREIKINLHLNDKNVIKLYHVFSDQNNLYMVMEPMIEGDLWNLTKKQHHITEKNTKKIITNICKGVSYIHEKDIIHRDLKLENILLTNGIAKLGDFGCAVHSLFMRKSTIGSPYYLSPQQMGKKLYNKKIDIWCIGVMTFQLLFGHSPFAKQIQKSFMNPQEIPNFELKLPSDIKISSEAEDFLRKTLEINANQRIDIEKALNHPFLRRRTTLQCPI